jgi:putative spermidine/putrescine transport system ATP-binding protein
VTLHSFRRLRLEGVGRRFAGLDALKNVNLVVERGEFIALLGPSGCGKSTALNCLAGLLPLTEGTIHADDARIDVLPPEDRGFGMVFQNYALFPHMTVASNIGFGLRMQRVARAEIGRRVTAALKLVRLESQAQKLPGQLSGGQQQRVAIARAVVVEPPLVLMDEPLSNLDAKLRLEMRGEIRRIHQLIGSATVYVTHDQDEALSLADRIVVLRDGEVRQIGTPDELYANPAHRDVADFMGFRNMIPATVQGGVAVVGGTPMPARPIGTVADGAGLVAVRPEDLVPGPDAPLAATVLSSEYRGRDFYGIATMADGVELFFRAATRPATGEAIRLGPEPGSALLYAS